MILPTGTEFVSAAEMGALEKAAFARGTGEETLMDMAAEGIASVLRAFFPEGARLLVFAGKGHNAADALEAAARLCGRGGGWTAEVRTVFPRESMRPLAVKKLETCLRVAKDSSSTPRGPLIILDGVLGTGSRGEPAAEVIEACRTMNALREREHAVTVAVDMPTALGTEHSVTADITVTPGYPKDTLFTDGAAAFAGRIAHVPLPGVDAPEAGRDFAVTAPVARGWLAGRGSFAKHKGQSGRVGIVAGSRGLTGAARLTATAAIHAGGGLVTLFCPHDVYDILAAACPPEVMVRAVSSCLELRDFQLDVIAAGPGMGSAPLPYLSALIQDDPRPVVLDADALNALAAGPWLKDGAWRPAGPRLLTPHPGELAKLTRAWRQDLADAPRREAAKAFTEAFPVTLAAKSARTFVIESGRPAAYNTTGHPLMARGGMGDVLTGFLAAFLGQGMAPYPAAALGSWLLGRGAEHLAWTEGVEESGTPSRVMEAAMTVGTRALREGRE